MTPEAQREIIAAVNSTAIILAGYYHELVRLQVPVEVAKAMTVAIPPSGIPSMPPYTSPAMHMNINGSSSMTNCPACGRRIMFRTSCMVYGMVIGESVSVVPARRFLLFPTPARQSLHVSVQPKAVRSSSYGDNPDFPR